MGKDNWADEPMTQRQLRDIASYWGAKYSAAKRLTEPLEIETVRGTFYQYPTSEWIQVEGKLSGVILDGLATSNQYTGFKLHLRPISSLTHREIVCIVEILEVEVGHLPDKVIYRQDEEIRVGSDGVLRIHFDGLIEHNRHYSCHTAPIIAYLQSIGVYVPGMIDGELVQLTT